MIFSFQKSNQTFKLAFVKTEAFFLSARRTFLTVCYLLLFTAVSAQQFDYNTRCQQAYKSIFKLKFKEGYTLLAAEKKEKPGNLMPVLIENYIDFLTLYIGESEASFEKLNPKKDERITVLKTGDKKSPYYLYSQASLHLQWAFTRIKFGEYLTAALEVKKAQGLLNENKEKFPQFKPNDIDLALLNALFGAIPDKYKFGAKMFGMEGDIDEGIRQMGKLIVDPQLPFKEEATIMYTMLLLHLKKDKGTSWEMIDKANIPLGDNLLNHFIASTVALHTGKTDKMISILSQRPTGTEYYAFPFLDYMLGLGKLNRLDKDADVYFRKFLDQYKGQNYVKEAWRKLGWHYLIQNNETMYKQCMTKVKQVGNESIDEDKSAAAEAKAGKTPDKNLLKSRLLSDGAYYAKALEVLQNVDINKLSSVDKIEFYYRKGRILDEQGDDTNAIIWYKKCITQAGNQPYYFAPNACIKIAFIYEKKAEKALAKEYYNKALTYATHEYKNSIDAEAKAGLNRLN